MGLKQIIEDPQSVGGRRFDRLINLVVFLSLVTFSVETLPDLDPWMRTALWRFEVATVVLFTVEYLLRFAVADSRRGFVLGFFGVVDLLAILPFYLSLGVVDLRSIRVVRILRLFRATKLIRYNRAAVRLLRAFHLAREELVLFLTVTLVLIYIASVGIYFFETEAQPERFGSVFASMWWAVATLTTVGYGDVYPVTVGGKIFTFVMLMVGLGVVAVPIGVVSGALTQARELEMEEERLAAAAEPPAADDRRG